MKIILLYYLGNAKSIELRAEGAEIKGRGDREKEETRFSLRNGALEARLMEIQKIIR